MKTPSSDGWDDSAAAWIASLGDYGDYGRRFVLDAPMMARIDGRGFGNALDIGCGEGRFCRMMQKAGAKTLGIDPTAALIARARGLDSAGEYHITTAEALDVPGESFDLAVCYLSLIDIPDLTGAVKRIVGALRPGGTLLIANLTSFNSAAPAQGWSSDGKGGLRFTIDHYLVERATWASWQGIRIQNWHRPLSTYMKLFLHHGLELRHFDEPVPSLNDARAERYRRVPWFHIMEWQKPG